jgi:predicted secreted protein with PEFG-CTERM motif
MNFRGYTVTSIAIAFMAVTLLSVPGFGGNAYAEHTNSNINHELIGTPSNSGGVGMSLSVDANAGSHSIMISGSTDRSGDVMIIVTAPNGNVVAIDQVTPSGNSYSATIGVGGSQYNQDGMYTILVQQGAQSGDTTYNSLNLLTEYQGGHFGKYKFAAQVEVTSGTTSATSISKSSCYGICNYEPSAPIMGSSISDGALTITASDSVRGSTTIDVSGTTDRDAVITLIVTAPNGNVVSVDQLTPSGGSYSTTIGTGGSQYSQDGMYTISAKQGDASMYNVSTEVEIVDGYVIPEFGTIAAMILVVAIVAIIAVSAKTKLSLVPKY